MRLRDIGRMGHVKRWQIVAVSREQTLADHTALVAMYSMRIYHSLPLRNRSAAEECGLLLWALHHDLPEVFTGDVSTPTKRAIGIWGRNGLEALEQKAGPVYQHLQRQHEKGLIGRIVKLADVLDASVFLWSFGIGDHAQEVLNEMLNPGGVYESKLRDLHRVLSAQPRRFSMGKSDFLQWGHNFLGACLGTNTEPETNEEKTRW
jgi:5'-deoxynucleotidase